MTSFELTDLITYTPSLNYLPLIPPSFSQTYLLAHPAPAGLCPFLTTFPHLHLPLHLALPLCFPKLSQVLSTTCKAKSCHTSCKKLS